MLGAGRQSATSPQSFQFQERIVRSAKPREPAKTTKLLFIEHLAEGLRAMELGKVQMNATAYRLYARRLRDATAGLAEAKLAAKLSRVHPAVADALATRFFNTHGTLPGIQGEAIRDMADAILRRLRARVA
jgi:hypothetical protein